MPDANRWDRLALLRTACSVLRVLASERPDVVISTGAAPGFFAILFGKMFGARTIWVDSIANVDASVDVRGKGQAICRSVADPVATSGRRARAGLPRERAVIFATVGTELPFDRMMRVIDEWVGETGRDDVFAQIGETEWRPQHMRYQRFLEPADFARTFEAASAIVSHAGMGTILSALRYSKPVIVMPRQARLGEQRNDHQLATARRLAELGKVQVAYDENDLRARLDRVGELSLAAPIGPYAQPELITAIKDFIQGTSAPRSAK